MPIPIEKLGQRKLKLLVSFSERHVIYKTDVPINALYFEEYDCHNLH